jgi:cytochrome oxidase assembly protein ShyY1
VSDESVTQGVGDIELELIFNWADGDQPTTMLMQEGVPVGIPPIVEIRNQHATYAVTW